jgi:hydrogenase/urease accessory protein HupE
MIKVCNFLLNLTAFLVCIFFCTKAFTHEVRPSYLRLIQDTPDTFRVIWKVPAKGSLRLGLHVIFNNDVEKISEPNEYFLAGQNTRTWTIRHRQGLVGTEILIKGLKSTFTEALVSIERLNGSVQMARLMPEKPFLTVKKSPSVIENMYTYVGLGIKHIWLGFDHLLFLLCLLFIAKTGRKVIITVTGFTLAHSLTLALSSLGFVNLALPPIEAIIALSIMFLASEIIKNKRYTLTWRYPATISVLFGLLHGFGFAAVLNDIGLPQGQLISGLLFFNLGIEIGQLVIVIALLALHEFLKKYKIIINQRHYLQLTAYGVGGIAAFWFIERTSSFL